MDVISRQWIVDTHTTHKPGMPFWSHNTSHKQTIGLLTDNLFYLLLICHGCQPQKVRVPSFSLFPCILSQVSHIISLCHKHKQNRHTVGMVHKKCNNLSIYIQEECDFIATFGVNNTQFICPKYFWVGRLILDPVQVQQIIDTGSQTSHRVRYRRADH